MIKETTHKKKSSHQENPINQGSDNVQGWKIKKLGEVCEISTGKSNTEDAIENGDFAFFDRSKIVKRSSKFLFDCDAIIVAGEGQTFLPKFYSGKFDLHQRAYAIYNFDKSVSVHYAYKYLIHFHKYFESVAVGATAKSLRLRHFQDLPIPIPPLPEQQRIVSVLNECFAAIDKAKANAVQNLKNAKELFESYLQGVFENGNWETKTIEAVCNEIFAGGDAPKNNFSLDPNEKHNIPIYANAVKARGLYGYTDFARVTKPCVTIAARGSGTGHTELRDEAFLPIVRLIVCIPDINQISNEFLKYTIDNLVIQRSGSAIPQLTVPMIKDYKIPVPNIEEQKKLIEKAETLRAETQKLEVVYQKKIANLKELKKSVLEKAFAGELRGGEPAIPKTEKAIEM